MGLQLKNLSIPGYEQVVKVSDEITGLLAMIAIHDTTLGPSLGGTRIFPYKSFDEALQDVLRLSRGMTYKSAIAQTGLGGGKKCHYCRSSPEVSRNAEEIRACYRSLRRALHCC